MLVGSKASSRSPAGARFSVRHGRGSAAASPPPPGMDAEDPTCARIHLVGKLVALTTNASIAQAKADLGARHPLAPWLAAGGAHTGGAYYTIDVTSLTFLDFYGGPAKLSLKEYLAAEPTGAGGVW